MTADLLFSPMRRRESVRVLRQLKVSLPILFSLLCSFALIVLMLLYPFLFFPPSVWPLPHLLLTYWSSSPPTASHFFFFFCFSSTPFISSRSIHPIVAGLQLLFLLVCTLSHLQYNPATPFPLSVSYPIFFLFL